MLKKVIIVLVEGSSDEELLIERLYELYGDCEIKFVIQNGDIFCNFQNEARHKSMKSVIGDIIKNIVKTRKYNESDVLGILHIMDTDGCFIPTNCIAIDKYQNKKTKYELDKIMVDSSKQQENIIKRNQIKSKNVKAMYREDKVVNKKFSYQLYYFSRNIEHVVFDEPNPEDKDKYENIEDFIESLDCSVEVFLEECLPHLIKTSYDEKYRESWDHIEKNSNSLKRFTNVPLLFEFINSKLKK